jgi:hypothetical protein
LTRYYTSRNVDGNTSVAPDSGTLAFDENGGNLVSVTAMDVAGNLATVDQTLVIDTLTLHLLKLDWWYLEQYFVHY